MVLVRANLLMFDRVTQSDWVIPEQCKIDIPKMIAVTGPSHTNVVGHVESVCRDKVSLSAYMIINSDNINAILLAGGKMYASGYFRHVTGHIENGRNFADFMKLESVNLTLYKLYGDDSTILEVGRE